MTMDSSNKMEDKEISKEFDGVIDENQKVEPKEFSSINVSPGKSGTHNRASMFVADDDSSLLDDSQPHLFEISYHPGDTPFYAPPKQRQRWGDKRVLPRVNWGDLFFDLNFVAATYHISNILVQDPSSFGFLYFAATFFACMYLWSAKTLYDSTFAVDDDIVHRILDVGFLTAMASVIAHIDSAAVLSHPADYVDMFAMSLSLLIALVFTLFRQVEIGVSGVGEEGVLKQVSIRNSIDVIVILVLQLAATIIAGVDYYGNTGSSNETHRALAGAAGGSTNNIPIILTLAGPIIYQTRWTVRGICFFPNDGSHKKKIVPVNIDFTIHRNMEWTILMLGESIFSLLVEEVTETKEFYVTFYCGLILVIILEYIHFTSQPMVAERHVMADSKNRAFVALIVQYFYCASMVGLGSGLTLFLRSFATASSTKRRLVQLAFEGRFLAGGGESLYPANEMKERAAVVFCISLGMLLFCVDILQFLHVGFRRSFRVLHRSKTSVRIGIVSLVLVRWGIIALVCTLWIWSTTPEILSEIGMGSAFFYSILVLVTRKMTQSKEPEHHQ